MGRTKMKDEQTCEMSGCTIKMESIMGDFHIYGEVIGRDIRCCADCHEEYTDLTAYGRPDYATQWIKKTQDYLV